MEGARIGEYNEAGVEAEIETPDLRDKAMKRNMVLARFLLRASSC